MNIIKLAFKNILHRPLNLIMSIILFALGVGLISFLILLNSQLSDKYVKNLADIDLVVGAKGSPLQLILCNMYHIDYPTGNISLKSAAPLLRDLHPLIQTAVPVSLGDNYRGYRIVGTTQEFINLYDGKIGSGRTWNKSMEVVIGSEVATLLDLKIGDEFASSHGFNEDDHVHDDMMFSVVGILEATGSVVDLLLLTDTRSVWEVHGHQHEEEEDNDHLEHIEGGQNNIGQVDEISENEQLILNVEEEITAVLIKYKNKKNFQALNFARNINENTDMQAASPAIELNRLFSLIGIGTDILRNLALLIALVSGVSIFISLLKSMRERRYELSLMRVLGAGRIKVFLLIILEGVMLAVIGYIVGMALSHICMEIAAGYLKEEFRYTFSGKIFLKQELYLLGASILLGLIAALVPAIQSARTDIHETLSHK